MTQPRFPTCMNYRLSARQLSMRSTAKMGESLALALRQYVFLLSFLMRQRRFTLKSLGDIDHMRGPLGRLVRFGRIRLRLKPRAGECLDEPRFFASRPERN